MALSLDKLPQRALYGQLFEKMDYVAKKTSENIGVSVKPPHLKIRACAQIIETENEVDFEFGFDFDSNSDSELELLEDLFYGFEMIGSAPTPPPTPRHEKQDIKVSSSSQDSEESMENENIQKDEIRYVPPSPVQEKKERSLSSQEVESTFQYDEVKFVQNYLKVFLDVFKTLEIHLCQHIKSILSQDPDTACIRALRDISDNYQKLLTLLDCMLAKYGIAQKNGNSSLFEEALLYLKKISDIIDQIPPISTVLSKNIDRKLEHVHCSFLGLEDEVAEYMLSLPPDVRNHQTDQYWIGLHFDQQWESLLEDAPLLESFQHLGFTRFRAKYLTDLLEQNQTSDHQSAHYWAQYYVDQIIQNSLVFSDRVKSNVVITNEDGSKVIRTETESEEEKPVDIELIEVDDEEFEKNELISSYKKLLPETLSDTTYWYHGTNHEAAQNIAARGIDLSYGKAVGDFSNNTGFYLTSNFQFALDWSRKMGMKTTAVVVFKVENNIFENYSTHELSKDDPEMWSKTISYFRNQHKDVKHKWLRKLDMIFGPVSMDGQKNEKNPQWKPRIRKDNFSNHIYQLCLKNDDLSEDFYNRGLNVERIFFFK